MIPGEPESFTAEEGARLAPYFTNLDRPVFALVNLPEVVKGALFARYSRSPKSLRRLFLDEFAGGEAGVEAPAAVGVGRAEQLYERVFLEFGDDSVAQLGGVHLACEGASNILTKLLEWGRLMAYLEQSTRYIPYTNRPGGRWRYHVPEELAALPRLRARYVETLDLAFDTYARWLEPMQAHLRARHPRQPADPEAVYRNTIRAKALDTLRGLLPAATVANVGLYGTGQAYEALLLRLRASPLAEAQAYADLMLTELRKVIPAFLKRVDLPDRGTTWSRYLADTREATAAVAEKLVGSLEPEPRPEVVLADYDRDGEVKVVAAALYAASDLPDDQLLARARRLSSDERAAVLRAYVGDRANRRHKPGRAFERTGYRFDVLTDYGAFRDLQRHRLLTLEWQTLSPRHGYAVPEAVEEAGGGEDWRRVMAASAALHDALADAGLPRVAPYAVSMAYRIRFYMEMNAREAMHVLELRTTPQGHPAYRRVGQAMHRLIAERAGHRAIAEAMRFVDHSAVELERLEAERRSEARRALSEERVDRSRFVTRLRRLGDDEDSYVDRLTPAQRLELVWPLTVQAWGFGGTLTDEPRLLRHLSALSAEGVEYLIVGAYALAAHGLPRATGDLDIWVRPTGDNADRVVRALGAFGAPLFDLTRDDLLRPDTVFQIGVVPSRIDVLTGITGVRFEEAWPERVTATIEGLPVPIIGVEELLRNKEASGRPQDLADAAWLRSRKR